jgi:hypothetical protein
MSIDERTSLERLQDASRELTAAQTLFQKLNHQLKQFDSDHPGTLTAGEAAERESLLALQQEALNDLKDREACHKFCHHEVYAQTQSWGRSTGKWWRNDRRYEDRG